MAYVLFTEFLKFNPQDPEWPDRDRFILSADMAQHCSTVCCTSPATICRSTS
jgi:transketolase